MVVAEYHRLQLTGTGEPALSEARRQALANDEHDAPQTRTGSGKNPQRLGKTSEDYETFDASHKRSKGPFTDDNSAIYADGVRIGGRFGGRHDLLEAEQWIWREFGSAAAPPDTDTVPGSFWDGVRDMSPKARAAECERVIGRSGDRRGGGGRGRRPDTRSYSV